MNSVCSVVFIISNLYDFKVQTNRFAINRQGCYLFARYCGNGHSESSSHIFKFRFLSPGVTAGKAAEMKVVVVPSFPKQSHIFTAADEVINSLLDLRPEKWGLPPFQDCKSLYLVSTLIEHFLCTNHFYQLRFSFFAGIEDTLPLEPWYIGGPVIKGFGRGSKVLGIPTGKESLRILPTFLFSYAQIFSYVILISELLSFFS